MAPLDVVTKTNTATIPSAYWARTEKRMRARSVVAWPDVGLQRACSPVSQ